MIRTISSLAHRRTFFNTLSCTRNQDKISKQWAQSLDTLERFLKRIGAWKKLLNLRAKEEKDKRELPKWKIGIFVHYHSLFIALQMNRAGFCTREISRVTRCMAPKSMNYNGPHKEGVATGLGTRENARSRKSGMKIVLKSFGDRDWLWRFALW